MIEKPVSDTRIFYCSIDWDMSGADARTEKDSTNTRDPTGIGDPPGYAMGVSPVNSQVRCRPRRDPGPVNGVI